MAYSCLIPASNTPQAPDTLRFRTLPEIMEGLDSLLNAGMDAKLTLWNNAPFCGDHPFSAPFLRARVKY